MGLGPKGGSSAQGFRFQGPLGLRDEGFPRPCGFLSPKLLSLGSGLNECFGLPSCSGWMHDFGLSRVRVQGLGSENFAIFQKS